MTCLFSCCTPIYSCEHRTSGIGSDLPFVNLPSSQSQPDSRVMLFPFNCHSRADLIGRIVWQERNLFPRPYPRGPVLCYSLGCQGAHGTSCPLHQCSTSGEPDSSASVYAARSSWVASGLERPTVQTYCADLLCRNVAFPCVPSGPTACPRLPSEVSLFEGLLGRKL